MYKFVTIFFAALAFQGVLARNQQIRIREAQELLQLVRSASNDASNSVQNLEVGNQQVQVLLVSEANELAHRVHEVAYHLQQIVQHNQKGQGQQVLLEVLSSLNDLVHGVQQALQHEPRQLQSELRSQLGNSVPLAEKLVSVVQQQQQSEDVNEALVNVLDDLVEAVQEVNVRNNLQNLTQQEVKSKVQSVVNEVSNAVQGVNVSGADVSRRVVRLSQHLAQQLDEVVRQLQRQVRQQGEIQNNVRQVVNKLRDIRVSLELVQIDSPVSDLVNQLKTNVNNVGAQLERLVQVVQSDVVSGQEAVNLRNVVNVVLARSLVAARQLQRNLVALGENKQEN